MIYLLRHGQTAWNKELIFRGRHDLPLDSHGLAQADCADKALENIELAAIYSSPLSRALQTAQPTARRKNLSVVESPELLDIDYGQWTGKSQKEIEEAFPELNCQWLNHPEQVQFPSGESLDDVRKRVFPHLLELARKASEKPLLIVSHRVTLKVLIFAALHVPLSKFWQIQLDTASLSALSFGQDKFTLRSLNDTCHLRKLGPNTAAVDF